jgi:hypothetical protein
MIIIIQHQLPQEKAMQCAEKIFKDLSEKFKNEFSDLDQKTEKNIILFSFRARSMDISGTVTVNKNDVTIESKLPFAARIFQGLIENKIKEQAENLLKNCQFA